MKGDRSVLRSSISLIFSKKRLLVCGARRARLQQLHTFFAPPPILCRRRLSPSLPIDTWRAKKRKKWRITHLYFTKYILGLQDRSTFQFFFHFRVCPPIRYAIIYRLSARHKFRPIIRDLAVRYTLSTLLSLSLPSDTFRGSKDSLPTLFYAQ